MGHIYIPRQQPRPRPTQPRQQPRPTQPRPRPTQPRTRTTTSTTKKELYNEARQIKNNPPCKTNPSLSSMNKSQLQRYISNYKN